MKELRKMGKTRKTKKISGTLIYFGLGFFITMFFTSLTSIHAKTTHITNSYQDEVYLLIQLHRQLASGTYVKPSTPTKQDKRGLSFINNSKQLLKTDLQKLVAEKGEKGLITHIAAIERLQNQSTLQQQTLKEKRTLAFAEKTACNNSKAAADYQFSKGINQDIPDFIEKGIENGKEASACMRKADVEINAYNIMLQKINTHNNELTNYKNILISNERLILSNQEIFSQDTLSNLQQITQLKKQLETVQNRANLLK